MKLRRHVMGLVTSLLAFPAVGAAQANPGDITFTVPLNLTQLSTGLSKVRVGCSITSAAITINKEVEKTSKGPVTLPGYIAGTAEFPVSGGRVAATATIVLATAGALDDPIGKNATYSCSLQGFSVSQQRWVPFNYSMPTGTEPALLLSPNPLPLSGTFTW